MFLQKVTVFTDLPVGIEQVWTWTLLKSNTR